MEDQHFRHVCGFYGPNAQHHRALIQRRGRRVPASLHLGLDGTTEPGFSGDEDFTMRELLQEAEHHRALIQRRGRPFCRPHNRLAGTTEPGFSGDEDLSGCCPSASSVLHHRALIQRRGRHLRLPGEQHVYSTTEPGFSGDEDLVLPGPPPSTTRHHRALIQRRGRLTASRRSLRSNAPPSPDSAAMKTTPREWGDGRSRTTEPGFSGDEDSWASAGRISAAHHRALIQRRGRHRDIRPSCKTCTTEPGFSGDEDSPLPMGGNKNPSTTEPGFSGDEDYWRLLQVATSTSTTEPGFSGDEDSVGGDAPIWSKMHHRALIQRRGRLFLEPNITLSACTTEPGFSGDEDE